MKPKLSRFSKNEFIAYLLLYAAETDFKILNAERKFIIAHTSNKEYSHVYTMFKRDSDLEKIEKIQSYRNQYFASKQEAEELMKEALALLKTDEEYSLYEQNFNRILSKILNPV
jgi:hypothetical protein